MTWLLPLLRKYWMPLALTLSTGIVYHQWAASERLSGALAERVTLLTGQLQGETRRADSLGKVYRVDTLRLSRYLTRWDTAYANVWVHDTLTLTHADTVRVPVQVLKLADSTIRSCRAVAFDCATRFAAESTLALSWKMKALTIPEGPSALSSWLKIVAALGAGYVAGRAH